jgi:chromosome segregation ATPase
LKFQLKLVTLGENDLRGPEANIAADEVSTVERLYELLDHTSTRNTELLKQKGELSQVLQEKEANYRTLAFELQRVTAELSARGSSMSEIQSALSETKQQLAAREAEAEAAAKALDDQRGRLAAAEQRLEEFRVQLDEATSAADGGRGQLELAKLALEVRDSQLAHTQEEVASLRQSVASLEAELVKVAEDAASMQEQMATLATQKAELAEEGTRLQQEGHLLQSWLRQRDEEISQTLLELKSVQAQLTEANASVEELTAANSNLAEERGLLGAEIEMLKQLVEAIEKERDETTSKLSESERWVFTLAGVRTKNEREIGGLERRLADEQELRGKDAARHASASAELLRLRERLKQVEAERDNAESDLKDKLRDELAALTLLLKAAEDDLEAAKRKFSAEVVELSKTHSSALADVSKQHSIEVAERNDEVATLTRLLREAERNPQSMHMSSDIGKEIALALQALPRWWSILPKPMRDKRKFAGLRSRGLFDGERYLQIYPDVAAERMDPLEHYLRHGMAEGRTSAID